MSDIHRFIGDCEGLDEYYLVTEDFMELYSITDHDDLLYIDVRRNEIKKLTKRDNAYSVPRLAISNNLININEV